MEVHLWDPLMVTSLSVRRPAEEEPGPTHSPVKSHFVSKLLLVDVAVQQVVADVGGGPVHALDKDLPFGHIKVVIQEGAALLGLPKELLGDVAPELCGTGSGQSGGHANS